ncbi:MAG: hypothetical protein WC353_02925 [Candidatus Peribacter sp.]|jgi:hypothetical protein
MPDTHILISWTAPEKPPHNRGMRWYLCAGLFAALLLAYAVYTQAWTFAFVIVLLALIYGLMHSKPPITHTVQISSQGLQWDRHLYPWSDLRSFWMLQGPGYVELRIGRNNRSDLIVQTGDCTPADIASVLSQFITPVFDRRESILDYLIRICKL